MDFSYLASFLKMLFALSIVLGIMLGAIYLLKRITRHTAIGIGSGNLINIISTHYLGPKSAIMMVDIAGRVLVMGVTVNAISLLMEIDDQKTLDAISAGRMQQAKSGPTAFPPGQYRAAVESWLEAMKRRRSN